MKKEVLYGIIGFLGGSLLTVILASNAVNNNNTGMMQMMGMRQNMTGSNQQMMEKEDAMLEKEDSMHSTMDTMTGSLKGKTGAAFDKTFLSEMIVHHQGAIEMAELAKKNAEHEEIKTLAEQIITAQTQEIEQMKQWQKEWGY